VRPGDGDAGPDGEIRIVADTFGQQEGVRRNADIHLEPES
jgi:hypothetical protein